MTANPDQPVQQPDPLFSRRRSPNRPSATAIDPILHAKDQVNQNIKHAAIEMCECRSRCAAPGMTIEGVAPPMLDMCITCEYAKSMSVMIQIRNVPADLHRRLKARAALSGMSLSDFLLKQIRDVAERPTIEELRARLASRSAVTPSVEPAQVIREERDRR